jgi:two-component system cell cycle sensor histidine kinase/response regulator CckA
MTNPTEPTPLAPASTASEQLFELALERLPTPTGVALAETGEVLHYNAAFERVFGYRVEDIPTFDAWNERAFPDPTYRAEVLARWAALAGCVEQAPGLFDVTCKDGTRRVADISVTCVGSRVVATFIDVTERERARAALSDAAESYRLALDAAALGTGRADLATGLIDLDQRARAHLGVDRTPATFDDLRRSCHPDDRGLFDATLAAVVDPKGPGRSTSERRVLLPSGELRWVGVDALARFEGEAEARRAVGFIATTRDTTTAHRAEEALRAADERVLAAQRMEALGRVAGGVAHDFNNLLTIIGSYASLAADEPGVGADLRDDLGQILAACRRAEALTQHLLAFSRRQVLNPARVRANELVGAIDALVVGLMGEDVTRAIELDPEAGEIQVDRRQIEQVLLNLLANARDAMPSGGRVTLRTRCLELDTATAAALDVAPGIHVELSVADTGCGMDEETRRRAFDPFFTTKPAGKGAGLGLSLVYGVVRQSGGAVVVESERGHGATFRLLFPQVEREPAAPIREVETSAKGSGETVLVVDDEAALRAVLRRALSSAGYTVLLAADGEEALRLCEAQGERIRLVLTDVMMPRMSGRVLADHLAELRPDLPVVFMSGYTNDLLAPVEVLEKRFVNKPFSIPSLIAIVRAALEGT